jgi:hypothetical protein
VHGGEHDGVQWRTHDFKIGCTFIIEPLSQAYTDVSKIGVYIYDLLINFLKCKLHWSLFYHINFHCYLLKSVILSFNNLSFFYFFHFLLMKLYFITV